MTRQHGALLHCDAAQAPCAMNMDGVAERADLVSLSAHNVYGPKGIGALYIRRDIQSLIAPMIHGGGQQRNMRSGTLPTPLCVGFGAAAELLVSPEADKERDRVGRLRDLFGSARKVIVAHDGEWQRRLTSSRQCEHSVSGIFRGRFARGTAAPARRLDSICLHIGNCRTLPRVARDRSY